MGIREQLADRAHRGRAVTGPPFSCPAAHQPPLLAELRSLSVRPTMHEWLDRSATWERIEVSESPADAIAAERGRSAA